uniref:SH2 domain containing 1A duplicate a n=1 Tax=Sinocyclocheilus grahami TaxID=75366 RepID=A0A672NT03_SINGR
MEDLAEYHGRISRRQAEEILNEAGRDGSYLIRDSASAAGSYCVCVLCDGWVYTYRVFKQKDKFFSLSLQVAPGMKERLFRNVGNLIAAFKFPDQGISVPLFQNKYIRTVSTCCKCAPEGLLTQGGKLWKCSKCCKL